MHPKRSTVPDLDRPLPRDPPIADDDRLPRERLGTQAGEKQSCFGKIFGKSLEA